MGTLFLSLGFAVAIGLVGVWAALRILQGKQK